MLGCRVQRSSECRESHRWQHPWHTKSCSFRPGQVDYRDVWRWLQRCGEVEGGEVDWGDVQVDWADSNSWDNVGVFEEIWLGLKGLISKMWNNVARSSNNDQDDRGYEKLNEVACGAHVCSFTWRRKFHLMRKQDEISSQRESHWKKRDKKGRKDKVLYRECMMFQKMVSSWLGSWCFPILRNLPATVNRPNSLTNHCPTVGRGWGLSKWHLWIRWCRRLKHKQWWIRKHQRTPALFSSVTSKDSTLMF